jgi:hypothetical protein
MEARDQSFEWGDHVVTYGDVLGAFASHCADDLDDVEVVERTPDVLVARWRSETTRLELRSGFADVPGVETDGPTMLLGDVAGDEPRLLEAFLNDADLRARVAVVDLDRLERIGAVRSSVFVYLEWFLRDTYGVKLLPNPRFTHGLIERGIIHLGMG